MTVLEVIQRSTEFLARKAIDSPRLQVELLLGHVLQMPRLRLYLEFERLLTPGELDAMRDFVRRRAGHEPLQHIVGSTSFCGLEIKVNRDVLVPRPETEVLAEQAWTFLNARAEDSAERVSALDFGTGSGCIALAIARYSPGAHILALDTSRAALKVAKDNAAHLGLAERIDFLEGTGLDALPEDRRFDLIVSNPPYIPSSEIGSLAPEVRDYDPRLALDGGPDGLDLFRMLARDAPRVLSEGGQLMAEFGDGQAEAITEIFRFGGWEVRAVLSDLSGRSRILIACRGQS